MSTLFWIIILAVAQGIAEFLPISSSGHLLVLGNYFGFDVEENMTLNVVLHAGTLAAIVIFYFKKLLSILCDSSRRRLIGLVIVGSIPAAVVGLTLKKFELDTLLFSSPLTAAVGFAVTATMLLLVFGLPWKKPLEKNPENCVPVEKMSFAKALLIGVAQSIAITPGISRSGSTISCGVVSRLSKADAAEFSFLLAIPAIGGAALLEALNIKDIADTLAWQSVVFYAVGFVVSAVVGYLALTGLIAMLQRGKLGYFACYLYVAAAVVAGVEIYKLF